MSIVVNSFPSEEHTIQTYPKIKVKVRKKYALISDSPFNLTYILFRRRQVTAMGNLLYILPDFFSFDRRKTGIWSPETLDGLKLLMNMGIALLNSQSSCVHLSGTGITGVWGSLRTFLMYSCIHHPTNKCILFAIRSFENSFPCNF